jgi:hypothetical protein
MSYGSHAEVKVKRTLRRGVMAGATPDSRLAPFPERLVAPPIEPAVSR